MKSEDNYIEIVSNYVKMNITEQESLSKEFFYDNPVLIILDGILSKQRKYDYVKNKIDYFKDNHSEVDSLEKLVDVIDKVELSGFCQYIDWNCQKRIKEIYDLSKVFLEIKRDGNFPTDLDAMRSWAKTAKLGDKVSLVKGVGIETFQYLRMMVGVDTSRPAQCITNFLEEALQIRPSKKEAIEIIEKVADNIGIKVRILDYSIWSHNDSEDWKDIDNYIGIYQVSNMGNIRHCFYKNRDWWKYKAIGTNKNYLKCDLSKKDKGQLVHRIVAKAFMPINNSDDMEVDHKDEDTTNNRLENLQWVTQTENGKLSAKRKKLRAEIRKILNSANKPLSFVRIKKIVRNLNNPDFRDTNIFNFDEQFEIAYKKVIEA
ncbi:NUMOD4 motif-containing HNH endonuclease [Enterococcus hulanensis]|uniref:NUMOD4 motif-containing HNH endonuclease n=1 Tax=Enterococcus hulanensis TaxID=2559929 RepID=UPI0010F9B063|nr:NUMOD4 motif-containing HNH endonuclease [Enterococcus hulanensis]